MADTKILVEVRGGQVQCIRANDEDVSVDVLDYDNLDAARRSENPDADDDVEMYENMDEAKEESYPNIIY